MVKRSMRQGCQSGEECRVWRDGLRIAERSRHAMSRPNWMSELFESIDAMDAERFAEFLTDDATFRFGNNPPVTGKAAIRDAVGGFFGGIKAIRHEVSEAWLCANVAVCHGSVTYTRQDGSALTVPFANILTMEGSLIASYLIFVDISGL
jgi:ketosteroid isomerase-like protein